MFPASNLLIFCSSRVQWRSRSCPLSRIKLSLVVMSRLLQFVSGVFTVCRKSTPALGQMENRGDQGLYLHTSALAACPHDNSYKRCELYLEKSVFSPVMWVPKLSELNSNVGSSEYHELL